MGIVEGFIIGAIIFGGQILFRLIVTGIDKGMELYDYYRTTSKGD